VAVAASKGTLTPAAQDAYRDFQEASTYHDEFVGKLESRYRAYRGVMERRSDAYRRDVLTPPYANHIVETTIASLLDERLRFKIRPRARMYDPGEFQVAKEGAKALEILISWQLAADRFHEKQRWFVLQNMIAGVTAAKICWRTSGRMKKRNGTEPQPVEDPETGMILGYVPRPVVTEEYDQAFDGPSMEVVNVADLIWDAHATSSDTCSMMAHRVWKTMAECREMAAERVPELIRWRNVEKLIDTGDQSGDRRDWSWPNDTARPPSSSSNKHFAVVEIWKRDEKGLRVFTIGNGQVLLNDRRNPYWHGEFPFIICSTQADLFRIPGMSQIEKIAHLQESLWEIADQRLQNLRLLNNAPIGFNEDLVDDPDDLIFAPGERWSLRGSVNDAVQVWAPNSLPSQVSLPAENMIKQDIQNLAGGFPFTSTSEASQVKADTATEAALVSSLAQRSVSQTKIQFNYAYGRMLGQMVELNKQYITDPQVITVIGADDEYEMRSIIPEMLRADFDSDIGPMNESLMRQERRAESQALYQLASSAAAAHAMMAGQGIGRALNLDAFMEDVLDNYDKHDKDRYFVSKPPAVPPPAPGGQAPADAGGPPQGTTAPQSIDPAISPSNAMSMSGGVAQQRYMAGQNGGG